MDLLEGHLIEPGGSSGKVVELLTGISPDFDDDSAGLSGGLKRYAHLRPRAVAHETAADGVPPAVQKIRHLQIGTA